MAHPDKIYVSHPLVFAKPGIIHDNPLYDNIEYIRKDTLKEWAQSKNERLSGEGGDYTLGYISAMIDLIDKINSL